MTDHPCKGLTKAQIEAFERIAINEPPMCPAATTEALLRAGLIGRGRSQVRRDVLGPYEIPVYFVPIPIHMQWCQWASEQPGAEI